jgi:predicted phosphodiesterase
MKGLFTADCHLQSFQYNMPEREDDYIRAFEDSAKKALHEQAAFLALLGDITNIKIENRSTAKKIRETLKTLADANIHIHTLRGNHDPEPIPFADIFGLPGLMDAERETMLRLKAGTPFQPYGPNGPHVCAAGYRTPEKLLNHLKMIRTAETAAGIPKSTELWLHAGITPAAPPINCQLDASTFHSMGWHTIIAGDTHIHDIWTQKDNDGKTAGLLISPGSKEMTDINERETRGDWLHSPSNTEPEPKIQSWKSLPYSARPYRKFILPDGLTEKTAREITAWMRAQPTPPIVQIETPDGLNLLEQPEIRKLALKLTVRKPRHPDTPQSRQQTAGTETRDLPLEKRLLQIATTKKLRPRTLEILETALTPS